MPANFCIADNHDEVAKFIIEHRHRLTVGGERFRRLQISGGLRRARARRGGIFASYVDFESMDRITPAAALILAAEYDRAHSLFGLGEGLSAINLENWKREVRHTLQEVGFFPLLGVEPPRDYMDERDGIYTLPFMTGSEVDGALIDDLIRDLARFAEGQGVGDSEELLRHSRAYDGLGEAIQNVEDHAYPVEAVFSYPTIDRWWMTGAVEPSKKRFNLIIYDQGISIPASLPRWRRFTEFKVKFLNAFGQEFDPDVMGSDGDTIAHAVELGESSTGKSWHGKGLPLMREIVENASKGSTLRIFSRCGEYLYTLGGRPSAHSFEVPLSGTLVEWDLYL
jgi:hypothetical protein